jgi:phthalate 4,5-cis-dihydrodiol dehydrogenase
VCPLGARRSWPLRLGRHLRLGVVGLGLAARSAVPAIVRHPSVSITAAADTDLAALDRFCADLGVSEAYQRAEDLCVSPSVDAVYIATPTWLHAEQVMIAADHGKHVLVEKPIAVSLEEVDRIIAAVERNRVQLVVGHSQSFEPPIRVMRAVVRGGELGPLRMINTWYFTDWLYRPRRPDELDETVGGGVVHRQGAHQFDIIRLIGGGLVRSVRATTGAWDRDRPGIGSYTAFLELEDDASATAVYSGYDHFQTTELTHVGEAGERVDTVLAGRARQRLSAAGPAVDELALKRARGSGGAWGEPATPAEHQAHFGLTVVSCERGDIRQSPGGLFVYDDRGRRELPLPAGVSGRDLMLQELHDAIFSGVLPLHDARWAKATLEVSLAVMASAHERREVVLAHQTPVLD